MTAGVWDGNGEMDIVRRLSFVKSGLCCIPTRSTKTGSVANGMITRTERLQLARTASFEPQDFDNHRSQRS